MIGNLGDLANGEYVSGEYFSGLEIAPAAGRVISPSDDRAGASAVMVLDYQYAERRFGDISRAVGQSIRVDDVLLTVIGVLPREFSGVDPSSRSDFYVPLHANLLIDSPIRDRARSEPKVHGRHLLLGPVVGTSPTRRHLGPGAGGARAGVPPFCGGECNF